MPATSLCASNTHAAGHMLTWMYNIAIPQSQHSVTSLCQVHVFCIECGTQMLADEL